jgi:hypothetical protein
VIWLRRYTRGRGSRRSVLRFAWLVLALQLGAFVLGNVMYPTYKVEVRSAYLESATAVAGDQVARDHERAKLAEREHATPSEAPATAGLVRRAAQAARWFDVKEHWVALGILVSAALLLALAFWDPTRDGAVLSPIVTSLAMIVAGTVWFAGIVGVLTAAWRAV